VLAGLRSWPRSAKVTVAVLGAWALLMTTAAIGAAAGDADPQGVRAAGSVEATVPSTTAAPATTTTTTAPATTTTTAAPTTTAPPTTAAPTTTAPPPPPPPTTAAPAPQPVAAPAPATTQAPAPAAVYYANCDAARAAGAAPVRTGDPGYGSHLDRDGDGVGCE
jgi:outer membrane biosynthesis protein TonB